MTFIVNHACVFRKKKIEYMLHAAHTTACKKIETL